MISITQYINEARTPEATPKDILEKEIALSKFPKKYKYTGSRDDKDYTSVELSISDKRLEKMFAEINGALYDYQGVTTGLSSDASFCFNANNVTALSQNVDNRDELEENGLIVPVKSWSEDGMVVNLYFLTPKGEHYIKAFFNTLSDIKKRK